ncbi:LLM class flavin-dependent oxidoreductase [Actinophytocola sediminis]
MHRSIVLSTDNVDELVEVALAAEDAGLYRVWTTENTNHDGVVQAAILGRATTRIRIGTGIAYAFGRAPLTAAIAAADVHVSSGGRFTLGLGAGTRGIRRRYGVEFDHPAPRLAEYAQLLKASWAATGALDFAGRFYQAHVPGWRRDTAPSLSGLDVYGSGLNPTMLRWAARGCDGVALHPLAASEHYLTEVVGPALAAGAVESGRPGERTRFAAWYLTSVAEDEQVARDRVRRNLAFYFATPSYASAAAGTPWESSATAVRDGFADGGADWAALTRLVDDRMIDDLTLTGTPAQVRTRLPALERRLAAHGVDELVCQLVPDPSGSIADSCRTIVDAVRPEGP